MYEDLGFAWICFHPSPLVARRFRTMRVSGGRRPPKKYHRRMHPNPLMLDRGALDRERTYSTSVRFHMSKWWKRSVDDFIPFRFPSREISLQDNDFTRRLVFPEQPCTFPEKIHGSGVKAEHHLFGLRIFYSSQTPMWSRLRGLFGGTEALRHLR